MAEESTISADEITHLLPKVGEYRSPRPGDLRGPCPMMNSLANHGYLPRDGRYVREEHILAGLRAVGVAYTLAKPFAHAPLLEHLQPQDRPSGWWAWMTAPLSTAVASFGMRPVGQVDSNGNVYINLDQYGIHNVVEHDISLLRRDLKEPGAGGDNHSIHPELLKKLLSCSSDGVKITQEDFAKHRKARIQEQMRNNPNLDYDDFRHQLGCTEIALIQSLFGNGVGDNYVDVPVSYVEAFLGEERFPREEGWQPRYWFGLGIIEILRATMRVLGTVGPLELVKKDD